MKPFIGSIVAADLTDKTFTIQCPDGVTGVVAGQRVLTIPITVYNLSVWGHLKGYMDTYDEKTGKFLNESL